MLLVKLQSIPISRRLCAAVLSAGFTAILLRHLDNQLSNSFAVCYKLARAGGGGVRGVEGGQRWVSNRFSFAIMYKHATHGEMRAHLNFHCELPLAVAMRSYL